MNMNRVTTCTVCKHQKAWINSQSVLTPHLREQLHLVVEKFVPSQLPLVHSLQMLTEYGYGNGEERYSWYRAQSTHHLASSCVDPSITVPAIFVIDGDCYHTQIVRKKGKGFLADILFNYISSSYLFLHHIMRYTYILWYIIIHICEWITRWWLWW